MNFNTIRIIRLQFWGIATAFFIFGAWSVSVLAGNQRDVSKRIVEAQMAVKTYEYEKIQEIIADLEADIASKEELIAVAEMDRQKAEKEGDALGVMRAELMISNYTRERDAQKETLTSYRLQIDKDAYYINNQDHLVADKEMQILYECYRIRLNIAQESARIQYLNTQCIELEKKLSIEQKKLELGYTIEVEVNAIQNQLDETKLMIEESELEISYQKDMLTLYGEDDLLVDLPQTVTELEGDFVSQFSSNSFQLAYYEQQAVAYQNYIANASDTDANLEKIKLELELVQLNKQQYQFELEQYVKQTEKNYKQAKLKTEQYDCKIEVIKQQIQNSTLLYEAGRVRKIDVMELETEEARLMYERLCYVCEAQLNRYILEHNIEN